MGLLPFFRITLTAIRDIGLKGIEQVGSHPCEYMFTLQIQHGMISSKKCCSPGSGSFTTKVVTYISSDGKLFRYLILVSGNNFICMTLE